MRTPPHGAEKYRVDGTGTVWDSGASFGNHGASQAFGPCGRWLNMIVSDGSEDGNVPGIAEHGAWEHVSVSIMTRHNRPTIPPNWQEMCWVKDLFWEPHEAVVQFHPAQSDYVNHHAGTLHLWRPLHVAFPVPSPLAVGVKDASRPTDAERRMMRMHGIVNVPKELMR